MSNTLLKKLMLIGLLSASTLSYAKGLVMTKQIPITEFSVEGDVYNQGYNVIELMPTIPAKAANSFSKIIEPRSYGMTFKLTDPFVRVIYKNKNDNGCVFEFNIAKEMGIVNIDYYSFDLNTPCDVKTGSKHVTLIVGSY